MEDCTLSKKTNWRIKITNMETNIKIGIHEQEKTPQRIVLDASIDCQYDGFPQNIVECFNYDIIYRLVTQDWPKRSHIDLIETCIIEFMTYVFSSDPKAQNVTVSIMKPDIFSNTEAVGVEAAWSRNDYEQYITK